MQLTTFMLVAVVEFSCWVILVKAHVPCFWLTWPLNQVTQRGGRKLTHIMMVAIIRILHE